MDIQIARAGLIDLDVTFFFQLAVFLTLVVILNRIAFRPLLALFAERHRKTEGARCEAEAAAVRTGRIQETVSLGLTEARKKGAELRTGKRDESVATESKILGEARAQAAKLTDRERTRLRQERIALLPALDRTAGELATKLATRLAAGGS